MRSKSASTSSAHSGGDAPQPRFNKHVVRTKTIHAQNHPCIKHHVLALSTALAAAALLVLFARAARTRVVSAHFWC